MGYSVEGGEYCCCCLKGERPGETPGEGIGDRCGVVTRLAVGLGDMMSGLYVLGSNMGGDGAGGLSINCGVLLLYATGCKMGRGGISGMGSSRRSTLRQDESSSNHWLAVRL